jgi:hypothetical protein
LGSTDIPGRSIRSRFSPSFKRIRTGIRCTTFTKLPVAFSGGSRLVCAPGGAGHALDVSAVFPEKGIDADIDRLVGTHFFELRFLGVGGDPNILRLVDDQQLLAGLHSLANLHGFAGDDAGGRRRIFVYERLSVACSSWDRTVRTAAWRASVLA